MSFLPWKRFFRRKESFSERPHFPQLLLLIGLIPFFILVNIHVQEHRKLQKSDSSIDQLRMTTNRFLLQGKGEKSFINRYENADRYYLEKEVETLPLSRQEITRLKSIQSHPALSDSDALNKRLDYLLSEKNQLKFVETSRQTAKNVEEVEKKLLTSIEVDLEDLKEILRVIEEGKQGAVSPQLTIKSLTLRKQQMYNQKEGFIFDMEIIKRECR